MKTYRIMKDKDNHRMSDSGIALTAKDYDLEVWEVTSILSKAKDNHDMYVRLENFIKEKAKTKKYNHKYRYDNAEKIRIYNRDYKREQRRKAKQAEREGKIQK